MLLLRPFLFLMMFILVLNAQATTDRPISTPENSEITNQILTLNQCKGRVSSTTLNTAVRTQGYLLHTKRHTRVDRKFTRKNAHFAMQERYQRLQREFEYHDKALQKLFDDNFSDFL